MADSVADEVIRRVERLARNRGNFESLWTECARFVLPRADDFQGKRSPGQKLGQNVFDSTAQLALPSFAAAMESMVCPRTQKWHGLRPLDPDLYEDEESARYCERLRDLMFRLRYSPRANFASQVQESFYGLGAFGAGPMFVEDGISRGILYQTVPLSQVYVEEDAYGVIDTVLRKYTRTARQAYQRWGDKLPEAILKAKDKEPEREFDFIHCVKPNEERKHGVENYQGMAYASYDVALEGRTLLAEGGYRTMPYLFPRYAVAPQETYGRSPAMDALADIKTLNAMSKTQLRYGEQVTDPAWVTADVDAVSPFSLRSGAINAGYMNERGEVLAKSLAPQGDPRFSLELADQRRQSVNRSFLVTLFQILVETPEMTATEAMLRAQEKGALLAPTMGRIQSELLGPLITRELDILQHAGALDALGPMPDKLAEAGGLLDIEYESPLTRAQRAEENVGILRTLETAGTVAQYDPSVLEEFDFGRTMRILGQGNGAPLSIWKTPEEKAAAEQQKAEQAALNNVLAAAPVLADTAKTAVEANKAAQGAPF